MPILSTQVLPDNTLEEFRIEFNKLVTDVSGLSLGNTFDTQIIFEGTTDDTFETALSVDDPTADRSIVFPDASGNVLLDSANIALGDNIELQFGTDSDLKIFHNGSNSIIRDNGTGSLFLEGDTVSIRDEASSETMADFVSDGAVTLYHNNVAKLASSAAGVDVTGNFTISASGTVGIPTDTDLLTLTSGVLTVAGEVVGTGFTGTLDGVLGSGAAAAATVTTLTSGGNIVSDTDSTDDLGTTSVRWANLYVDAITATDQITATGFTGTLDGILGSGAAAAATTTTLASTTITASGIIKTDDTTAATSTTDGSLQTDGGLSVAGDAILGNDVKLLSDASVLSFGTNAEVTLTHVHNDGLLLNADMQLQFRDSAINIRSDADGDLDINADDEIELNSTLIDINGNVEISGTTAQVGVATFTARDIHSGGITIANDGTIGSVGDADAIAISSAGVVTFSQTPVFSGDSTFSDDISLISDGAQIYFGENSEVTLTHAHNAGLEIKHTATADDNPVVLTLATGETDIQANDVLGSIRFQAPDEGTGTDAILVAAGIEAVSEGDFSSSNNATKLSFKTAASEAAAEKMSLSSAGLLTISDDLVIKTGGTIGGANDTDLLTLTSAVLTVAGEVVGTGFTGTLDGVLGGGTAAAATTTTLNTSGAVVHNDAGAAVDFRVEGDTQPFLLFASGTEDTITIGGSTSSLFNGAGTNARLAVIGSSNNTNIVQNGSAAIAIVNTDQTDENTAGLHFARADTDDTPNYAGASIVAQFKETQATGQYPSATLSFLTSSSQNAAPSLKMTLTEAGNLGIGTSAPAKKLNVSSSAEIARFDGTAASNDHNISIKNNSQSANTSTNIFFADRHGASSYVSSYIRGTASGTSVLSFATGGTNFTNIYDSGAPTVKMTITAAGNVGIGNTSPTGKLDVVGGRSYFAADSEAFATYLRYNNSTAGCFVGSPAANEFQVSNSSGAALLKVNSSGTAICTKGSNSFAHLDGTVYGNGGARALNTNYTNSEAYDKIIYVSVSNAAASALMITVIDGDTIYGHVDPDAGAYSSATYIWPAGKVININMNGTPTLQRWVEYA